MKDINKVKVGDKVRLKSARPVPARLKYSSSLSSAWVREQLGIPEKELIICTVASIDLSDSTVRIRPDRPPSGDDWLWAPIEHVGKYRG